VGDAIPKEREPPFATRAGFEAFIQGVDKGSLTIFEAVVDLVLSYAG
jgi:hypothetical protein